MQASTFAVAVPVIHPLADVLAAHELTQADLAQGAGLSRAAANRLVKHGLLPARKTRDVRQRLLAWLQERGVPQAQAQALLDPNTPNTESLKEVGPAGLHPGEAAPPEPQTIETQEEDAMLQRRERINESACKHFNVPHWLFTINDVQTADDMFISPHIRYVRRALQGAADMGEFVAIVGESGAGKSTLRLDFEEATEARHSERMVFIKPHPREPGRASGRPLRASQIEAAFFRALAPNASRKSNPDDRTDQICDLLTASAKTGYRHLLVIDEAHRLPVDTLKQLKNFAELRHGRARVLGVALFGQPELLTLLSERNPEVREVVQRFEVIELAPLDNDLEDYLRHKFARAGVPLEDVFAADALDAIRARLIHLPRGGKASDARSICHPMTVANLVARAMNAAALVGYPKVDANVVAGC